MDSVLSPEGCDLVRRFFAMLLKIQDLAANKKLDLGVAFKLWLELEHGWQRPITRGPHLAAWVQKLKADQREVIKARRAEHVHCAAIASEIGRSEQWVKDQCVKMGIEWRRA